MRVDRFREAISVMGFDAFLISNPKSVFYFSSFLSLGAVGLIVEPDEPPTLFVSQLEYSDAEDRADGCRLEMVKTGEPLSDEVVRHLKGLKPRKIGLDDLPVSFYLKLIDNFDRALFHLDVDSIWKFRRVKDNCELAAIRKAAKIADDGVASALNVLKPGVRENEIAAEIERAMRLDGSEGTAFKPIIASGLRSAHPHSLCSRRKLRSGDLVIIDIGAVFSNYCSDITRTFIMGSPSLRQSEMLELVLKAQEEAMHAMASGRKACEVDAKARRVIGEGGYGPHFIHGLGHGLGLDVHEPPLLNQNSKDVLEWRNVVTNEPGIYVDGVGGVRVEDTVLVLDDKVERLTKTPRWVDV